MATITLNALPPATFCVAKNYIDEKTFIIHLTEGCSDLIKKVCQIAWNILSIIIFPIGLIRLAVRTIAPMFVLPATTMFDIEWRKRKLEKLSEDQKDKKDELNRQISEINRIHDGRNEFLINNNTTEQITIKTIDNVEIDTVKIKNDKSDKWIIYFWGNSDCYEYHLEDLKTISLKTGANIYTGNYRGVMRSKEKIQSTQDMVYDGKAMVEKLLSEGVPEENILIYGNSIGGGVATEVASNYPKVHHCNERSFGTLIDLVNAYVPVIGTVLGIIAWLAGWKFNSVKNFQKIEGKKMVIYSEIDEIIPFQASLYKALKNKNTVFNSMEIYMDHSTPLSESKDAFENHLDFIKDALKLA